MLGNLVSVGPPLQGVRELAAPPGDKKQSSETDSFTRILSQKNDPEVLCMAPSPNAGHTLVLDDDTTIIHKMLPLGILSKRLRAIYLGPGSLIDPNRLLEEIRAKRGFLPLSAFMRIVLSL